MGHASRDSDQPGTVHSPLGIIAGGGSLPREVADAAARDGRPVLVVALAGESESGAFGKHPVTIVKWGEIGRMVKALRAAGVHDLVILGSVSRPDLTRIRTDTGFFRSLPRVIAIIAAGGDDSVLRRVVRFFEAHEFRVLAPSDIAPDLLAGTGTFGAVAADPQAISDIALGFDVVARLAPFDIGQAAVVRDGKILAIEAAEGTDRMLERLSARLGGQETARRGVLVKRPKPGQERRVDMPAIGPMTIERVARLGLAGIAVEAGGALIAERAALVAAADAARVFVTGVAPQPAGHNTAGISAMPDGPRPRVRAESDAAIAEGVMWALDGITAPGAVIVVRRRVLAIETGDGLAGTIRRAGRFRSWGLGRLFGGRGVAVVAAHLVDHPDVRAAAREAGLALRAFAPADARERL